MLCCGWAIYQVPQEEKIRFMMYGRQQRLAVAGAAGYNKLGDFIDIDARLLSASSLPPSVQEFGPEITPSTFQDAASQRKPFVVRHFVPADLQQKEPYRSLEHDPSGDFKGYFSEMGLKWGAVPLWVLLRMSDKARGMLPRTCSRPVTTMTWITLCGIFEGARSFCSSLQRINRTCTCLTQPI
jgi:hypothetical protein